MVVAKSHTVSSLSARHVVRYQYTVNNDFELARGKSLTTLVGTLIHASRPAFRPHQRQGDVRAGETDV
jgi:hypothetical protein